MTQPWAPADRPTDDAVRRRRVVIEAASRGDTTVVRPALTDKDDRVRETALRAMARLGNLDPKLIESGAGDGSHRVRRALAKLAASEPRVDLARLISDRDTSVCQMACWAAGERAEQAGALVGPLVSTVLNHTESLCREAAVAALGAIGADEGLPAILSATSDRATVRRRAVLALAPFDTPEVSKALERALEDRDWQVRQAAEDLQTPPTP